MKKETEQKTESNEQQTVSSENVRGYFTKEVNNKISEMGTKEMESLLKNLITSKEWIAILKYVDIRKILLDAQLRTVNPSSDPHIISWSQGALAGLCDIENYIIDLNRSVSNQDGESTKNDNPSGV